jgi:hypothetical protein
MELSTTREAASCATTREIPRILVDPKVHYRIQKSPPLVPILSQTNPIHTTASYLYKKHLSVREPALYKLLTFHVRNPLFIRPGLRLFWKFRNKLIFYGVGLLSPGPKSKLQDHPLSAVRGCLFNIFAATFHSWRAFLPSTTWGQAMLWCQGDHLKWWPMGLRDIEAPTFSRQSAHKW